MKKLFLVAGARPNFMKIAPVVREVRRRGLFSATVVHTGQHYDANMSDIFFQDLDLPEPDIFLGVGSGSHAVQTANVMTAFEQACLDERPDLVVVVGDVNSTMACAITSAKLQIPVAHVEAGLRSRDRSMPEEINRLVTDAVADILLTPSADADENLLREGVGAAKLHRVGNVMIDSLKYILPRIRTADACSRLGLAEHGFGLVTLHRPSNVDSRESLGKIAAVLAAAADSLPVVFPVHPRTRRQLEAFGLTQALKEKAGIILTEPLGYREFMHLVVNARYVLTDSGGLQEETTWLGIPCITLRTTTERPVTVVEGTNELADVDTVGGLIDRILAGAWKKGRIPDLWDGEAAQRVVDVLSRSLNDEEVQR